MTSLEPRNPETDELLSPENSMFLLIDYQPTQVNSINSMNKQDLIRNVTNLTELMKTFDVPIVLSTVNVATGRNKETIPQLKELLSDVVSYDRTSINSWEDKEVNEAVKKYESPSFAYNDHNIVSSDVLGMTAGSIFDPTQTMVTTAGDKQLVKTVAWYDNEYSFTCQMVRTLLKFATL